MGGFKGLQSEACQSSLAFIEWLSGRKTPTCFANWRVRSGLEWIRALLRTIRVS